jgi:hypothetical protein
LIPTICGVATKLEAQTQAMEETKADVVFSKAWIVTDEDITAETKTMLSTVGLFAGPDFSLPWFVKTNFRFSRCC